MKADQKEIGGLIQELKSDDRESRIAATRKLESLGSSAVKPLIEAAGDKSVRMRVWAITALGNIGDLRAKPVILRALKDDHPTVRNRAEKALERLPQ